MKTITPMNVQYLNVNRPQNVTRRSAQQETTHSCDAKGMPQINLLYMVSRLSQITQIRVHFGHSETVAAVDITH